MNVICHSPGVCWTDISMYIRKHGILLEFGPPTSKWHSSPIMD